MLGSIIRAAGVSLIAALVAAQAAGAAETVTIGTVGQGSVTNWPSYIATAKGYFDAEGIKPDFVYAPSNTGLVQQLAAGSVDVALSSGLVDPIRAIDKGAPVVIVALEMQSPPYALLAKPSYKSMAELKGKIISLGGPKDITRIFVERMLAPNGVKPGEFDMVFAGATAARFSALQSGAVDAALLLPPFNFYAESAGFRSLGLTVDYAPDLPFSGSLANRNWAGKNTAMLKKLMAIEAKSIAFMREPANRDEAIKIMVDQSKLKPEDVANGYDFLEQHRFFANAGTVSKTKLRVLVAAMRELGDVEGSADLERFVAPGVSQVVE